MSAEVMLQFNESSLFGTADGEYLLDWSTENQWNNKHSGWRP